MAEIRAPTGLESSVPKVKRKRGGDSDLLVLSVFLKKEQKENDEVAKAIERLRLNGVNCVYFTMDDIRKNGSLRQQEETSSGGSRRTSSGSDALSNNSEVPSTPLSSQDSKSDEETTFGRNLAHGINDKACSIIDNTCSLTLNKPASKKRNWAGEVCNEAAIQLESLISTESQKCGVDTETPSLLPKIFKKKRRKKLYPYRTRPKKRKVKIEKPSVPPQLHNGEELGMKVNKIENHSLMNGEIVNGLVNTVSVALKKNNHHLKTEVNSMNVKKDTRIIEVYPTRVGKNGKRNKTVITTIVPEPIPISSPISLPEPVKIEQPEEPPKSEIIKLPEPTKLPKMAKLNEEIGIRLNGEISDKSKGLRVIKKRRKRVSHFHSSKKKKKILKLKPKSSNEERAQESKIYCVHSISPIDVVQEPTNNDTQIPQVIQHDLTEAKQSPEKIKVEEGRNETIETQVTPDIQLVKDEKVNGVVVKLELGDSNLIEGEIQLDKIPLIPDEAKKTIPGSEDSLPGDPDAMQLRRSSFYSLISTNVRNNLENHLDGRSSCEKIGKRRKRMKNGFLLHHGDNCPQDPESPYRFHLATQISLKLNKRRVKNRQKEGRGKTLLSYLKLDPKRSSRTGKTAANVSSTPVATGVEEEAKNEDPIFSGEWTQKRKFICKICNKVEDSFWDIVMHKGEEHPGVVVTHADLPTLPPPTLIYPPIEKPKSQLMLQPPSCSKCSAIFTSFPDLHRHIFECAGSSWLEEEPVRKKKGKRRKGFKRRFSNTPRKQKIPSGPSDVNNSPGKVRSEVFKCEFCTREFKTEGWLKNHIGSHTLLCSIPLKKLTLPSRASFNSSSTSLR